MNRWRTICLACCTVALLLASALVPAGAQAKSSKRSDGKAAPENEKPKVVRIDPSPDQAAKIGQLIEQLGAPTLRERDLAMSEIAAFGAYAIGQVEAAIDHDDDEVGHRCVILLEVLNSGQAELFLAARKLGMSIPDLQVKLNAPDPSHLLAILEQNSGAGMGPVWARVLSSLATMNQRYPAALACRRVEGPEGYGNVLRKASREPETRNNIGRVGGLIDLIEMLPPARAEDTALTLAALPGLDGAAQTQMVDRVVTAAVQLRGLYETQDCLAVLAKPENLRELEALEKPAPGQPAAQRERLLIAVVLALTPLASEAQIRAAKLPPLSDLSAIEIEEYCALCARSKLSSLLERALTLTLGAGADERKLAAVARGIALCEPYTLAFDAFDLLPVAAQLAVLDAWWFSPPPPEVVQPFLLSRLNVKIPAVRNAAARLIGGYRANSTAAALAKCALMFEDTAPRALEALAPMAELLPKASPEALKDLTARLAKADSKLRPALIDVLAQSGDPSAIATLKARFRVRLNRNEFAQAVKLYAAEPNTAIGAFCAGLLVTAVANRMSEDYYLRMQLSQSDFVMARALLIREEEAAFALLESLAADPHAPGSGDALLTLAMAGRDNKLSANWARLYAAGNDPRSFHLGLALAVSQSPQGEEFRAQALERGIDSPELPLLITAVMAKRAPNVTREALLSALLTTPANLAKLAAPRLIADGALPADVAKTIATSALFATGQGNAFSDQGFLLLMRYCGVDAIDVLFGSQPAPIARTPQQIAATALLGDRQKAKDIIARVEAPKDGRDYELRELARAWVGLTPEPQASCVLRAAASGNVWLLLKARGADEGSASDLRALLDMFGKDRGHRRSGNSATFFMRSYYRGDSGRPSGVADSAWNSEKMQDEPVFWLPLVKVWLGEDVSGNFGNWWSSRRGLVQFDAGAKRLTLAALK